MNRGKRGALQGMALASIAVLPAVVALADPCYDNRDVHPCTRMAPFTPPACFVKSGNDTCIHHVEDLAEGDSQLVTPQNAVCKWFGGLLDENGTCVTSGPEQSTNVQCQATNGDDGCSET